jgi:hypothetical protein
VIESRAEVTGQPTGSGGGTTPTDAVKTAWTSLGGAGGYLGNPTTGSLYTDPTTQWPREDYQGGAIFIAPNGQGGTQPVALGTALMDQWQAAGGTAGPLGLPIVPPAWASSMKITTLQAAGQQPTTGGHNGQVAFFQKGLIYSRDGLSTPDVMTYDTPQLGYDTAARFRLQLLDQFTDENGLVIVNYEMPPGTKLSADHPIADKSNVDVTTQLPNGANNDSAWMSGQAVAILAMNGDLDAAALVLGGIVNHDWNSNGDLLRYPGNTKLFLGLDPDTQIAGSYNVNTSLAFSAFGYSVSTGFNSLSVTSSGFSIGIGTLDFGYFYSIDFGTINIDW